MATTIQTTGFRACEPCRAAKVRCEPAMEGAMSLSAGGALPPVSERPPCRRCRDTGSQCIYTEPRRTKRKRTDVRVRELEREVRLLSELLTLQHQLREETASKGSARRRDGAPLAVGSGLPLAGELPQGLQSVTPSDPTVSSVQPELFLDPLPAPSPLASPPPTQPGTVDPVAAGLLSMDKAVRLFRRYVTIMAPQRPFVVFPPVALVSGDTLTPELERTIAAVAARVREQTPILFLSIMAAAVGTGVDQESDNGDDHGALGTALDALLLRVYAERIMYEGQKSVELVQALLISSNWNFYYVDERPNGSGTGKMGGYDQLRFYQHLHLAATMSIELCSMRSRDELYHVSFVDDPLAFDRTALACYMCCSRASVSLGLHRQAILAFTPQMAKCLAALQTSPHALPTDAAMVAWVQLQRIVDTSAAALGLRTVVDVLGSSEFFTEGRNADGASSTTYENAPDTANPSYQLNLQNVMRQLEQWRQDNSRCITNSLLMQYHSIVCLLHESCFYDEFDIADFKPPYRIYIPSSKSDTNGSPCRPLTPSHIASRAKCLTSARALIGIFLSSPADQLLGCPVAIYARVGYSIVVLLKLQISAALPGGAMNGIVKDTATGDSATQIYQYLEALMERLQELHARSSRLAGVWLSVMRVVYAWYETYFVPAMGGSSGIDGNSVQYVGELIGPILEPLRHCLLGSDERRRDSPARAASTRAETPPHGIIPFAQLSPPQQHFVTDEGYAAMRANYSAFVSGASLTMDTTAEEILSSTLASSEIDRWMDPGIELGDIQSQLFEFPCLQMG